MVSALAKNPPHRNKPKNAPVVSVQDRSIKPHKPIKEIAKDFVDILGDASKRIEKWEKLLNPRPSRARQQHKATLK
jgi:hypothetical protein